jgi:hypothetical protein
MLHSRGEASCWNKVCGKLIDAVDADGHQNTYTDVLSKEWIARNTTEAFRELLHAKQNVFIRVPVGTPHPNSYPYIYDKKLPSIAFPQEDRNTCVTSSFASCLHSKLIYDSDLQSKNLLKSLINFPAHIEQYGHEYIANRSNNQSKIIQSFCTILRENHENYSRQQKLLHPHLIFGNYLKMTIPCIYCSYEWLMVL